VNLLIISTRFTGHNYAPQFSAANFPNSVAHRSKFSTYSN